MRFFSSNTPQQRRYLGADLSHPPHTRGNMVVLRNRFITLTAVVFLVLFIVYHSPGRRSTPPPEPIAWEASEQGGGSGQDQKPDPGPLQDNQNLAQEVLKDGHEISSGAKDAKKPSSEEFEEAKEPDLGSFKEASEPDPETYKDANAPDPETFKSAQEPDTETLKGEKKPDPEAPDDKKPDSEAPMNVLNDEYYFWRQVPTRYSVDSMLPMPTGRAHELPKIQTSFQEEDLAQTRETRQLRKAAVQKSFQRCWDSYKEHAWLQDELRPVNGSASNRFGGWGATLVDNLDTLWIMGLEDEFELAVSAAANISFEESAIKTVNVFETTIRYLGGFLSAYDLSGDQRVLKKAREVGDMLYVAFDTPNRMPITRWEIGPAAAGEKQEAPDWAYVAEIGTLCLEFTRLSLITGDPKWFDATERIMLELKKQQMKTQLPGMWPIGVDLQKMVFTNHNVFTLGSKADSVFEYLPKMVALTGGLLPHYEEMYKEAMKTAIENNLFRPMIPDEADILVPGIVYTTEEDNGTVIKELDGEGQHLACFVGGMLAVGSKLFDIPEHLTIGKKLVDGCIWTYENMPSGIMPEIFRMLPCDSPNKCPWDKKKWEKAVLAQAGAENATDVDAVIERYHLRQGFVEIRDTRYILRPEAIESIFVSWNPADEQTFGHSDYSQILYRTTGDASLLEKAWNMFEAIERNTKTQLANSAIADVTATGEEVIKTDSMQSFWMGETLKYFYLIFSEPDTISLDEYVLNTEAHPLRRQTSQGLSRRSLPRQ